MVEAGQEPETEIEKRMRHPVSYQNLLLWALNDVRLALGDNERDPPYIHAKLKTLLALMPPELIDHADAIFNRNMAAYNQAALPFTHRLVYRIVGLKPDDYSLFHRGYGNRYDGMEFGTKAKLDEFIEQHRSEFERGIFTYETKWVKRTNLCGSEDYLINLYRQHAANTLRELVALLDDNGLLREIKREDVGRL